MRLILMGIYYGAAFKDDCIYLKNYELIDNVFRIDKRNNPRVCYALYIEQIQANLISPGLMPRFLC